MLRALALLLVFGFFLASQAQAQEFEIPSVTIEGGGLPGVMHLAPADADAFRRRVNQLPRLEDPPDAQGASYTVTSIYWPIGISLEDEEDIQDVAQVAVYYPDGGFLRTTIAGEDAWVVLNLRQRAILDRYIRLAEDGLIGERPSTLAVMAADASADQRFGISIGQNVVDYAMGTELVRTLAEVNPEPLLERREPPVETSDGYWLILTLPEGRVLQYYHDGETLTEGLGSERYDASAVSSILDDLARGTSPAIEHQQPGGSLLWWPLMLGAGLVAIGVSLWLRKRGLGT